MTVDAIKLEVEGGVGLPPFLKLADDSGLKPLVLPPVFLERFKNALGTDEPQAATRSSLPPPPMSPGRFAAIAANLVSGIDKSGEKDDAEKAAVPHDAATALPASPAVAPAAPAAAPVPVHGDPSAANARNRELAEAAAAVVDTLVVRPALTRGDGEVTIRLKPTILGGSEIKLKARGKTVTVEVHPATPHVAVIVERSQAQLAQQLAERMPSFNFIVNVKSPASRRKNESE